MFFLEIHKGLVICTNSDCLSQGAQELKDSHGSAVDSIIGLNEVWELQ